MGRLDARWRKYLHNPLWYVATVTVLAALTLRMRAIWWLAGAVALVWGTWLIWQFFSAEGAASGGAHAPEASRPRGSRGPEVARSARAATGLPGRIGEVPFGWGTYRRC